MCHPRPAGGPPLFGLVHFLTTDATGDHLPAPNERWPTAPRKQAAVVNRSPVIDRRPATAPIGRPLTTTRQRFRVRHHPPPPPKSCIEGRNPLPPHPPAPCASEGTGNHGRTGVPCGDKAGPWVWPTSCVLDHLTTAGWSCCAEPQRGEGGASEAVQPLEALQPLDLSCPVLTAPPVEGLNADVGPSALNTCYPDRSPILCRAGRAGGGGGRLGPVPLRTTPQLSVKTSGGAQAPLNSWVCGPGRLTHGLALTKRTG